MIESLRTRFRALAPAVDYAALRVVEQTSDLISVRQDQAEPVQSTIDRGAMVTVIDGDGLGYAATSDLSDAGLRRALEQARAWAELVKGRSVLGGVKLELPEPRGDYTTAVEAREPLSKAERLEILMNESRACRLDDRVVDWAASLWTLRELRTWITADGAEVHSDSAFTIPGLHVTAHANGMSQTRSWGGRYNGFCQQGGLEILERAGFFGAGRRTAEEALELLLAPNCPSGARSVLLMPDQMMLQIHESIGHPIELDRILGDERNYAGTSFVTLDMFGSYQYGSSLLNVTHDPTYAGEFASFAVDDEGSAATREYLIRDGRLLRPLGGTVSAQRAGVAGVATARASSWNRPPIDRMSNLNLEPGSSSLEDLIASIEDGVLMKTNVSWSIDDSRNKFQFGCEWGQRIVGGRLREVVRNPNYRGRSATFWRSLVGVGDRTTVEVLGTPFCGKGEPNQAIRVGHASPACVFENVEVFGAES